MPRDDAGAPPPAIWIVLLSTATVLFSFGFACATPFAALATVAGARMDRRDALTAVTLTWLGNQAIGFALLHYPTTPTTFAWGAAIGLAALSATLAASAARNLQAGPAMTIVAALGFAFVAYEGVLLATAGLLSSGFHAFAPAIVARIAAINVAALLALLVLFELSRVALADLTPSRRPRSGEPEESLR